MIKCICFDGFNTIENGYLYKPDYTLYNEIAFLIGCKKSDIEDHLYFFCKTFGNSVWEYHEIFWRSLVQKYCTNYEESLIDQVYNCFLDFYEKEVELFDGTLESLSILSKKVKLILIANGNSKRIKRLIKKFHLHNYFSDFIISSETPFKKPDEFMFLYGIKKYGLNPNEVMMVGDKYGNDIMGANKCGLITTILNSGCKAPSDCECLPDFMVDSISEIIDIVDLDKKNKLVYSLKPIIDRKTYQCDLSAFIVAGGKGSRLGNLGATTQKCMLNLWGKPIIYYTLMALKNIGCSKIIIAVNHLANQIISYFGDGSNFGLDIIYLKQETQSTYDAIYQSLDLLTDQFLYVHGNILFKNELLNKILNLGNEKGNSVLACVDSTSTNVRHAQFAINKDGTISNIDLTERNGKEPYTFLGLSFYRKSDFKNNLFYSDNGEIDVSGMVEKVVKAKLDNNYPTFAYKYRGGWRHIETESDYYSIKQQKRWDIYYE